MGPVIPQQTEKVIMFQLVKRTRPDTEGASRRNVYFTSCDADAGLFDVIAQDILTITDCTIWHREGIPTQQRQCSWNTSLS